MGAWEDAVDGEFVQRLVKIAQEYHSERDLLNDLENFGGRVYEELRQVGDIRFGNSNE